MESDDYRSFTLSSGVPAVYHRVDQAPQGVTWVTTPTTRGMRVQIAYAYRVGENPFGTPGLGAPHRRVTRAGRPADTTHWVREDA
jgi:hypothetical protein